MQRASFVELARLKRGIGILATVGSTAPFVGLFGTVVGIINAFKSIGASGGGGINVVAGGIAEALVATAFGLLVAIPAVWAYNALTTKVEGLSLDLDNASAELIEIFLRWEAKAEEQAAGPVRRHHGGACNKLIASPNGRRSPDLLPTSTSLPWWTWCWCSSSSSW